MYKKFYIRRNNFMRNKEVNKNHCQNLGWEQQEDNRLLQKEIRQLRKEKRIYKQAMILLSKDQHVI